MSQWKKATKAFQGVPAFASVVERGGVQQQDERYNPRTFVEAPPISVSTHDQQYIAKQTDPGLNASYYAGHQQNSQYPQSPFVSFTPSNCMPQQSSAPTMLNYPYDTNQPNYDKFQNQPVQQHSWPLQQESTNTSTDSRIASRYPSNLAYANQELPQPADNGRPWINPEGGYHGSSPPVPPNYTPQRSETSHWPSYDPIQPLQTRSQTVPLPKCYPQWCQDPNGSGRCEKCGNDISL